MAKSQDAEAEDVEQEAPIQKRAALYIDGFNLYYPICELGEDHLKWLNLYALGKEIIPSLSERLVKVVYCTALPAQRGSSYNRHTKYIEALEMVGVEVEYGHHIWENKDCTGCGDPNGKYTEKATDINLALSLFNDGLADVYDVAYLLSADSDQSGTAKFLKRVRPELRLISVTPPNKPHSKNVMKYADGKVSLNQQHLERCRFSDAIVGPNKKVLRCPIEYRMPT